MCQRHRMTAPTPGHHKNATQSSVGPCDAFLGHPRSPGGAPCRRTKTSNILDKNPQSPLEFREISLQEGELRPWRLRPDRSAHAVWHSPSGSGRGTAGPLACSLRGLQALCKTSSIASHQPRLIVLTREGYHYCWRVDSNDIWPSSCSCKFICCIRLPC